MGYFEETQSLQYKKKNCLY